MWFQMMRKAIHQLTNLHQPVPLILLRMKITRIVQLQIIVVAHTGKTGGGSQLIWKLLGLMYDVSLVAREWFFYVSSLGACPLPSEGPRMQITYTPGVPNILL